MSNLECYFLEWRYPIERNDRVFFNDDINEDGSQNHDYYIDNVKINKSVTGIIHQHFPHFNADKMASDIIAKEKWMHDPKYKYYQMPKCDIVAMWNKAGTDACELGSTMHEDIEMFYNYTAFLTELHRYLNLDLDARKQFKKTPKNEDTKWQHFILDYIKEAKTLNITTNQLHKWLKDPYPEFDKVLEFRQNTAAVTHYPESVLRWSTNGTDEFKQFMIFYNDTRTELLPYRTELIMFNEDYQLAGSIDMLFKDPEGNILIYDWKRSKEFKYGNYFKTDRSGFGRLKHLPHCNISHYSLQLNMYRRILETKYGETVTGMSLIRMHPNLEKYDQYMASKMDGEIQSILDHRLDELAKLRLVNKAEASVTCSEAVMDTH